MTKPIGIYVRVSRKGDRDEDDGTFHSPKEQAARAKALVEAHELTPGQVFEDIDVSGATAPQDRPAMSRLLAAVESGELGGIAAFALDRLSRDPGHGDDLIKRVTKAGGVILAPDIPDAIDSPSGEFTFGVLMLVARHTRSLAKERWATATERAILRGIQVGRTNLGYRKRPKPDRRMELDPETAPLVRECYERRAAGAGWNVLTDLLTERTGRRWTVSGARELIRNEIYKTGRLRYGDLVSEWDAGAIVDPALWAAAQRRGPAPRETRSGGRYLLSGLARCATCGYALNPGHNGNRRRNSKGELVEQKLRRRYKCRNRSCTAKASVGADLLERYVVYMSFEVGDELERREAAPDLTDLQAEVDQAARRLDWVTAPEAVDALGPKFAATAAQYRAAHDAALLALGEARAATGYSAEALRLREVWDNLSPIDRRDAMTLFWKEVRVGPKVDGGLPITLIARGPGAEVALDLSEAEA